MINYPCVPCKTEMRCEKNEVAVVHFTDNDRKKGIDVFRLGDLYQCPKCGCRVVLGMGTQIMGMDVNQKKLLEKFQIIEVIR